LLFKCITLNQAIRAIDMTIVLMIAASLAMGITLQATGGAAFIAHGLVELMQGFRPANNSGQSVCAYGGND
jgi:di/tricarboxylate transporter